MAVQVAMLRGINLGPSRRVPMGELRDLLTHEGYGDVRTYMQSGNVVLSSRLSPPRLERELERHISSGFGIDTRVLVRTREELAAVVALDPLGDVADDPRRYQVSFLSAEPAAEAIRTIAAAELAPERFAHHGREIYAWHPAGVHASALAKLISDRRLGVTATARNWRTVTTLLAMAGE
jgi:uncharacterized protein (DUF1697 family)